MATKGTWKKGKEEISGIYYWNWHKKHFVIYIYEKNGITTRSEIIHAPGDKPEWSGWKLIEIEDKPI